MTRVLMLPPADPRRPDGAYAGGWWHEDEENGRVVCDLCPRECHLKPGDKGFCFVRENRGGEMVLTTFGKSTGFCVDPIEKKPLNHFYPGTSVLSFGTAGCNLGCKFCQNWDISKSKEVARLSERATPEAIAGAARSLGCKSVAFTYNDPVVWAEYAIETAKACRGQGVKAVAVTAGYITAEARGPFFEFMDAANVDLKGFTEEFYKNVTYSHLQPVLDTLAWLKAETDVWFEITNLVVPRENDSDDEFGRMCGWVLGRCGDSVPVHFTAFHPDFRMTDRPGTPHETLLRAYEIARREGLKFVYVGNVNDVTHQSTYCPHCGELVIERNWYELGAYRLKSDRCLVCGGAVAGRFDEAPGTWGRKRMPVDMKRFANTPGLEIVDLTAQGEGTEMPTRVTEPEADALPLSTEQRARILSAAAGVVTASLIERPVAVDDPTLAGAADLTVEGAYVTLKRGRQLRACCGMLATKGPLRNALWQAAGRTAKEDHRLPPLSVTELPYLDLSVNLLSGFKEVSARGRARLGAVEVGRHGLRLRRGNEGGLLLPCVAVENGWDAEAFLRQVCRKAGLPTTAWEDDDAVLFTFEAVEFGGPFDTSALDAAVAVGPARLDPALLRRVADHARGNVEAMRRGMAPNYYLPGVADGQVTGLVLTAATAGRGEADHLIQVAFRPGVPFQATLFGLCEAAAKTLAGRGDLADPIRVGVTILTDPATHGTAAEPDLRGIDPARRALLLLEQGKTRLVYSPGATPEGLLDAVKGPDDLLDPHRAGLYSLEAQSTENSVVFRSSPKGVVSGGVRPASQAGRFYPSDPEELSRRVGVMLAATERAPGAWPAAMVPHAGFAYSGKVAAAVFNRLKIPETVIVIGPKHTRDGVDWAVDPHDAWSIPGGTVPGEPGLARMLAEGIPGVNLDAEAHRFEHAIEVELPFLHRLSMASRVVGVAVGGGDWGHCQRFAEGLAGVIKGLPAKPLLLISSDMNHFATDRENRLLDETALAAMGRLDPEHLLETVGGHNISMCGVVPAVIVMETLRLLGGLNSCERVAYATSAEASGDRSRVVGYAGVLLS